MHPLTETVLLYGRKFWQGKVSEWINSLIISIAKN